MMPISDAQYINGYKILIQYPDGTKGVVDFSSHPRNNMFASWNDIDFFRSFRINPECGVLEWPNGLDLAPEYVYSQVTGIPIEDAWSDMLKKASKLRASKH